MSAVDFSNESSAWSDLASYAWPEDVAAQQSLRRGLYVGEFITLSIGILSCLIGLLHSTFVYTILGSGLPLINSVECFVESPSLFSFGGSFVLTLWSAPLSLGFTAARASAIAQ